MYDDQLRLDMRLLRAENDLLKRRVSDMKGIVQSLCAAVLGMEGFRGSSFAGCEINPKDPPEDGESLASRLARIERILHINPKGKNTATWEEIADGD